MVAFNNTLSDCVQNSKDSLSNSYEYENVVTFKSRFDRKLFPEDFDVWTVHKQYTWINKNLIKFFPNVPQSLLNYIPAAFKQPDFDRSPVEIPEWLDMEKYSRGQKFVRENWASIMLSSLMGIICSYSFDDVLKPLIITRQSDTPYLGFIRYLSTIQRLFNWYNGQPWVQETAAYKDMQYTRRMHLMIRKKLCQLNNEQINNASKIAKPWCSDRELLLKDFTTTCPLGEFGQRPYTMFHDSPYRPQGINNADMTSTQCNFLGFAVLYPTIIGIHNATDEDLDAFCHMWRCYGYFLGIADEYNFCRGSFEEIKQRTQNFYQCWIIPNLRDITPEWEHMTRCIIESMNYYSLMCMSCKTIILLTTDILNLSMSHLHGSLSYLEWIAYKSWTFIMHYAMRFSSLRILFNKMMQNMFEEAANFTPEKHEELQKRSEKQLSNFSIVD